MTSVATGIGVLLNVRGGHMFLRRVNVTCTDLAWFTFSLHRVYQPARESRCSWRCLVADVGSPLTDKIATSSANDASVVFPASGMSAVNIENRSGPRTLPCGTPAAIT